LGIRPLGRRTGASANANKEAAIKMAASITCQSADG
jgi:hypothetical protein